MPSLRVICVAGNRFNHILNFFIIYIYTYNMKMKHLFVCFYWIDRNYCSELEFFLKLKFLFLAIFRRKISWKYGWHKITYIFHWFGRKKNKSAGLILTQPLILDFLENYWHFQTNLNEKNSINIWNNLFQPFKYNFSISAGLVCFIDLWNIFRSAWNKKNSTEQSSWSLL